MKEAKWSYLAATVCGVACFLVYVLDLGTIFPVSSDPMPIALFAIEIIGTVVSLPLAFLAVVRFLKGDHDNDLAIASKKAYSPTFLYIAVLSIFLGCGIIIFATISAMGV